MDLQIARDFFSLLSQQGTDKIAAVAESSLGLGLLLCFFSGILTSLTPCVYPMIPVTISIFGRSAREDRKARAFSPATFKLAMFYVAGMCFTYSLMGLFAGMTGSLFGKLLQSSVMLAFLTVLFGALGLGQLGVFKISLPPSLQTKLASAGGTDNKFGIFIMGSVAGLIVSPCVGPVIAGILAFVLKTSDALKGLLYFFSFSLGLGVLFLVMGAFSGVLAKLPRSGPWMNGINRFLAMMMFLAAGYYALLFAKQTGFIRDTSTATSLIAWRTDIDAALAEAKEKNLPVMVDFAAEWCAACHEIDKHVFHDSRFVEKIKGFIPLRLDVTNESPENEAKLKRFEVFSLPSIVFVKASGEVMKEPRINGFIPAEEFTLIMDQVK